MQSIHGVSFHKRVAQFPLNAVCRRAQWSTVVLPFTTSSVLPARIRPAGGGLLSSAGAPPPSFRSWLQDSSRRHRQAYSSFDHTLHILTSLQRDRKIVRTPASQIFRPLHATMAPLSVAADEATGRQLRRRKESHSSVSTTQVVASVRKKQAKATVRSSPTDNDGGTAQHREESFATDLEARLWNLEKTDQLTSLTVVELRALMKQISRPTAGRKEELIGEVRKWLTDHQASANRQTVVDCTRPTRESSSDADSLEGTLLKVESKSREMVANSRMTESFAVADLREPLLETKLVKKKSETRTEEGHSLPNGYKLSRGGRQRKPKPETDAEDDDELPEVAVPEKKSRASRNRKETRVEKVTENLEESVDEEGARTTTVAVKKRKGQVSKTSQSKKGKVIEEEKVEIVEAKVVVSNEPWTMLVHKKLQPEWIAYNPTTMRPEPPPCGTKTMKVMSWNVNGLRALMKGKDKKEQEALILTNLAMKEDFDVLCLQETKLQEKDVEKISNSLLSDYADSIWSCSTTKLGYSGTAVLSRVKPLSVRKGMGIPDHDDEGRLITVEFDKFFLLASYVPNSGERLQRLSYRTEEWDPALSRYIRGLEKHKPVVLTGDLNCADEEIDIFSPDANKKTAGFTAEERASFKANFLNEGMVDTFRRQHPNAVAYTYWGYRSGARPKNQGWRLDYFLVSESLADQIHDSYTCPDVPGSDHCPLGIILKI